MVPQFDQLSRTSSLNGSAAFRAGWRLSRMTFILLTAMVHPLTVDALSCVISKGINKRTTLTQRFRPFLTTVIAL